MNADLSDLAKQASVASEDELELLFKLGIESTSMGAGTQSQITLKEWLATEAGKIRDAVCSSPVTIAYLHDPTTKSHIEWVSLIAGLVAIKLAPLAAIPATEALLRKGLSDYCAVPNAPEGQE